MATLSPPKSPEVHAARPDLGPTPITATSHGEEKSQTSPLIGEASSPAGKQGSHDASMHSQRAGLESVQMDAGIAGSDKPSRAEISSVCVSGKIHPPKRSGGTVHIGNQPTLEDRASDDDSTRDVLTSTLIAKKSMRKYLIQGPVWAGKDTCQVEQSIQIRPGASNLLQGPRTDDPKPDGSEETLEPDLRRSSWTRQNIIFRRSQLEGAASPPPAYLTQRERSNRLLRQRHRERDIRIVTSIAILAPSFGIGLIIFGALVVRKVSEVGSIVCYVLGFMISLIFGTAGLVACAYYKHMDKLNKRLVSMDTVGIESDDSQPQE